MQASRSTSARGAFFIIICSLLLSIVFCILRNSIRMTAAELLLLDVIETVTVLLFPAVIGLFQMSGQGVKSLHLTHIEPGKMAHLFLAGVFLLFPVLLVNGVTVAVMTRFGIMQNHTDTGIIFFPAMIVALLLKPLSAALFYDEYLSFVLRRQKKWMVLLVPILLYAFQIGLKTGFVSAVFLAVLQVLCFHQSFSMLAPVLVLAGYGFSQSIAGINGLINSYIPGPGGTALLIFGTLAECMCLVKIWQIPVGTSRIQLPTSIRFERGEKRLLIGTGIAVILAIVAAEVFR